MKKLVLLSAFLALPAVTFAGGMGSMNYAPMAERSKGSSAGTSVNRASTAPTAVSAPAPVSSLEGSSENPINILESRQRIGTANDNYIRYSFSYIPKSYWERLEGVDLVDPNGFVELEEYFSTTDRERYQSDIERERERQNRARNKALRLRSIYYNR